MSRYERGLTYSARTQDVVWLVREMRSIGATLVDVEMFDDSRPSHRVVVDFAEPPDTNRR